jgi:phosphate-selective porin OprO/OprP
MKSLKFYSLRIILVLMVVWPGWMYGQESPSQSVLIRNVTLFDPKGDADDKVVNILIRKNKLEVVTEDKISRSEAEIVVNAHKGIIMGRLEVGQPPNFMILDEDPRVNFEVLLDTKEHAIFAVHDGRIVKNLLTEVVYEDPEEEPKKSGWLAYTPPPLAVPMNYADTTKWNRWDSRYISGIFTSAVVLDRTHYLSQDEISKEQVGDLGEFEGGEIRGLRFGVVGTLNFEKPWVYTIFGATNAFDKGFNEEELDDFALFDWRLDIPFFKNSVMSLGKQKEPISGERIQSMIYNAMQERSAPADAMMPSRNVGIVWNGYSPERRTSWAFGVFNDWFDVGQDFNESSTQYIGRFVWAPFVSEDESNILHLGIGYRYSGAKEGFRFSTEPEFNKAPVYVDTGINTDTGVLPADKFETYNAELAWRRGPLWLSSEYTRTDVKSPLLGNPSFDGYYVSGAWALTGEMRAYNKRSGTFGGVPISKGVYQNGKGAWELAGRYSKLDLDDRLVQGGKMEIASLGVNWWLSPFFAINMNYRYIWNEIDGMRGTSSGVNTRLLLILE